MTPQKIAKLKSVLEKAHIDFMENNEIAADALEPALKFQNPVDKEFVAFVCSILAYGRIAQVKKSIHAIIDPMGETPVEWLIQSESKDLKKLYKNWKHRFNTAEDILLMLEVLKQVYTDHGTLENFILPANTKDGHELLTSIREKLYSLLPKNKKPKRSFHFFIPDTKNNSASKRMNLYLKWMVRDTEPDFGIWKTYPKDRLLIPLDTHVYKQAKSLGITKRNSADLITATEITEFLKKLDASDPTRFDFALCHLSINGIVLT